MFEKNGMMNARNSTHRPMPAMSGGAILTFTSIDPGEGRLLYIAVTEGMQGTGAVKASGCLDGISVAKGAMQTVAVALH
jgi:hypothetical protein